MTPTPRRIGLHLKPSRSEAEAITQLYTVLTTGAHANEARFSDPDDDWTPIWLVYVADGHGTLITGDAHKHDLAQYVGAFARRVGAVAIGHLHSSWMVWQSEMTPARAAEVEKLIRWGGTPIQALPERQEVLLVQLHSAMAWEQHLARIERFDGAPPKLHPFERMGGSSDEGLTVTGAMVDPLREALTRLG